MSFLSNIIQVWYTFGKVVAAIKEHTFYNPCDRLADCIFSRTRVSLSVCVQGDDGEQGRAGIKGEKGEPCIETHEVGLYICFTSSSSFISIA